MVTDALHIELVASKREAINLPSILPDECQHRPPGEPAHPRVVHVEPTNVDATAAQLPNSPFTCCTIISMARLMTESFTSVPAFTSAALISSKADCRAPAGSFFASA